MDLTLEQRMASAIGDLARKCWEGGVDDTDVRDVLFKYDLIQTATADARVADESWAREYDICEGDDYERLSDEILAIEKTITETA